MIQGAVNAALEAVLPVTVRGAAGSAQDVEAVIDTGFSGFLTLPSALATALGLAFDGVVWAVLADGSEASFDMYDATLLWDGQPRSVYVYAAETTPLNRDAPAGRSRPSCRGSRRRPRHGGEPVTRATAARCMKSEPSRIRWQGSLASELRSPAGAGRAVARCREEARRQHQR